jgi:uncharacterized protein
VLLVDSNVWVASQDAADPNSTHCQNLLRSRNGSLYSPATVITETAWFVESRHGPIAEAAFVGLVSAAVVFPVDLVSDDWVRIVELIETYASLGLGIVDASLVAVAERLNLTEIATMNGRDFRVVRPKHCDGFTLLPEGLAQS